MKRLLLLPTLTAALAATVWAQGTPVAPSPTEQANQLKQNRDLVKALVDGGLRLAKQEDRLERARSCNSLAERFVDEIRRAARGGEGYRAAELGQHLSSLLREGVAGNVKKASALMAPVSPGMEDLKRICDDAKKVTAPLDEELKGYSDPGSRDQIQQALQVIHDGRKAVEEAVPSAGPEKATSQPVPK